MVFLIRFSKFFGATIWPCEIVCFLYSSFSHFQLEAFIGNSQSAKACKLSTVKVANDCQNTDTINAYRQVLFVCYLKLCFLLYSNFAIKFLE